MARSNYGPQAKKRAKRLLEALLTYAHGELEDCDCFPIQVNWQTDKQLVVRTKVRFLEELTAKDPYDGKLNSEQIKEALKRFQDFLEILEDNRTVTRGAENWHFTLKLWYGRQEKAANLERFDREWEQHKRPEKSTSSKEEPPGVEGTAACDLESNSRSVGRATLFASSKTQRFAPSGSGDCVELAQCATFEKATGLKQRWQTPIDTPTVAQKVSNSLTNTQTQVLNESASIGKHSLPMTEPELPIGQVPLTSDFYVERPPVEPRCYQEILQPGALIRIKAPRLMGKTSLMTRILQQAREHGYQTVPLSFQLADRAVFTNLDTFLRWFCESVGRRLKRLDPLDDYWTTYGSKDKTTAYFEECLLAEIASPLVIGLDAVDRVFPHRDIAEDFFSLLRAWYEYAKYGDSSSELWKKLRLVLVHCKEVYIPLDINQSPFNVGMNVELQEFSQEQVQDLVERHRGLNWTTAQVEKLMELVGGHPYLVRQALYHVQHQDMILEQLLQTAPTEAGIYRDHLRRHLYNLKEHPHLVAAFREVVKTPAPVELDSEATFKLYSMGLIVYQQENQVTVRCDLYRRYFQRRLDEC